MGFAAWWFFKIEVRLDNVAERRGGGTGDGACDVYPPGLVTVVRDRYSAGGVGEDGVQLQILSVYNIFNFAVIHRKEKGAILRYYFVDLWG